MCSLLIHDPLGFFYLIESVDKTIDMENWCNATEKKLYVFIWEKK